MSKLKTRKKAAKPAQQTGSSSVREIIKITNEDRRYIKRLRKLGASNYEIATALGISEDAPVLME